MHISGFFPKTVIILTYFCIYFCIQNAYLCHFLQIDAYFIAYLCIFLRNSCIFLHFSCIFLHIPCICLPFCALHCLQVHTNANLGLLSGQPFQVHLKSSYAQELLFRREAPDLVS